MDRLFQHFVSPGGDCFDSGVMRGLSEAELDQNGELLFALHTFVCWTGRKEMISRFWEKIVSVAEFPLKESFRHPAGLLCNRREYWERHSAHGIEDGCELAYQVFVVLGLEAASSLAAAVGEHRYARRWKEEAARLKHTVLHDPGFRLVDDRGFIKRRAVDGSVQETIQPSEASGLPGGVPLAEDFPHFLNPDASAALPVAFGFVPPESPEARLTMNSLRQLWNLDWDFGGYGRYHVSSEPDSPGAWPFPSLFIARAFLEMGEGTEVWRVLRWLDGMPGGRSGSWFEFYGDRKAPPFPQVGIPPWTWAELILLCVRHIAGIRPSMDSLRIHPHWLPGLEKIKGSILLRDSRLSLDISPPGKSGWIFIVDGVIMPPGRRGIQMTWGKRDIHVEAKPYERG